MKKMSLIVSAGLLMFAGAAQANYSCSSMEGLTMEINEKYISHVGNAKVTVTKGDKTDVYYGQLESQGGDLLEMKVIKFFPYEGKKVTIVSSPKNCGRGYCAPEAGKVVTANLKLGEFETYFVCHEKNP